MDWLIEQAKTASPFVAVFCLVFSGLGFRVLWKQHQMDLTEIKGLNSAYTKAMTATARALERIASSAEKRKRVAQDRRSRAEP